MTRGLTAAVTTGISGETVVRTVAVELDFPSGFVRWNASPADITISGNTFTGVGALGSISMSDEGTELRSYGLTVGLSGIPRDAVTIALSEDYQGRAATVWDVPMDTATLQPLASPVIIFRGRMDQMEITLGETAQVTLKLENRLTDWERARITRYTDVDQRDRDANDGSFRFVSATTDKDIIWPARSFWQ